MLAKGLFNLQFTFVCDGKEPRRTYCPSQRSRFELRPGGLITDFWKGPVKPRNDVHSPRTSRVQLDRTGTCLPLRSFTPRQFAITGSETALLRSRPRSVPIPNLSNYKYHRGKTLPILATKLQRSPGAADAFRGMGIIANVGKGSRLVEKFRHAKQEKEQACTIDLLPAETAVLNLPRAEIRFWQDRECGGHSGSCGCREDGTLCLRRRFK